MNLGYCLFGLGIFFVGVLFGLEGKKASIQADVEDARRRQQRGMDIVRWSHLDSRERGYSLN